MRALAGVTVLIVEDGDEYLESLSRFVPGPRYLQAKSAAAALAVLVAGGVDLLYLDMRFDRIPRAALAGDHGALAAELGDPERAWVHLEKNQGLYILDALRAAGYGSLPVVVAYDFSHEPQRLAYLRGLYPRLTWVGDAVTAEEIAERMRAALDA